MEDHFYSLETQFYFLLLQTLNSSLHLYTPTKFTCIELAKKIFSKKKHTHPTTKIEN